MNKILTSIWFLALVIAVPVIWFFPPVFDKYSADLEDVVYNPGPIFNTYFVDLNSDGSKEQIKSYLDGNGRLCLQYFSKINAAPVDQLNFSHEFHNRLREIYFDDIDKDGFTEIYGFTVHQDSIFLNWFEPYPEINGLEHSKFITRIGTFDVDKIDINIVDLYFLDINKDGTDDLVFPVSSGFSLKPRNIFVFDIKNDTVHHSEYTGRNQFGLNFADLNGDSKPEIIADNSTSGNLKDSLGNLQVDNVAWLQVFNPDLTPYFPPIRFTEGLVNGVNNFVVGAEQKSILTFHFDYNDSLLAKVFLFNAFGEKMDSLFLPQKGKNSRSSVLRYNENEFLIVSGKYLTRISSDLKILGTTILPIPEKVSPLVLTNLFDDKQQLIFVDFPNNKLLILLEGFKHLVEIEFEKPIQSFTKWNNLGNGNFYVLSNYSEYYFHLRKNNLFYLGIVMK